MAKTPTRRGPKLRVVTWLPVHAMMLYKGLSERRCREIVADEGPDLPPWLWRLVWAGMEDAADEGASYDPTHWLQVVKNQIAKQRGEAACFELPEAPDLLGLADIEDLDAELAE